ncbi:MAG: fused MFS/spermidine synthase, partial [Nitrospira sp.]|nr:fused MFS/spermidine synthase [Nitrospira sp.]
FDPVVVRMAEEYFAYRPPANHHVYVKDGRAFLNATDQAYDLIWIDAFARDMIPFHLTTAEFYALVRARLNPDGIVAVNLASSGKEGDLARASAVVQTMKQAFPVLESFAVEGPWKTGMSPAKNLVFFGGRFIEQASTSQTISKMTEAALNQRIPMETIALLNTRRTDPWPQGVVLSDDFAPYDLLLGRERSQLAE